jgi:hypothetical protein
MEIDAIFAGLLGALDRGGPGLAWQSADQLRDPRWVDQLVRRWPSDLEGQVRAAVHRVIDWLEEVTPRFADESGLSSQ